MIKQDLTIIQGVTCIQELKSEQDISGFSFSLSTNHPERTLPQNFIEAYDIDKGWLKNKADNPSGEVRINIPGNQTSNWLFLDKFKYSIMAKSADGISQVIANGKIAVKAPEDAEPTETLTFEPQGATGNLIKKLLPIIEKEAAKYKLEEKQLTIKDIGKLEETLASLKKELNVKAENDKLNIAKEMSSQCSQNKAKFDRLQSEKADKQEIDELDIQLNKKIDSFASFNGHTLRLNKSFSISDDGTASLHSVHFDKDAVKAKAYYGDDLWLKNQNITDIFAKKNGDQNEAFKAKSITLDGQDLSFLKTLEQRLQTLSKRISDLEKNNGD